MQAILIQISGRWGHFKKPESNNNPLTHDFITKTALIGMMGAVLGQDREPMRSLFPILSDDLLYGVALQRRVQKQSWGFTLRRFNDDIKNRLEQGSPAPRPFELLVNPCFQVVLALSKTRSVEHFTEFARRVQASETHYDPILGLHNCPAELKWIAEGTTHLGEGDFLTRGFIPRSQKPKPAQLRGPFRIGAERLPTHQNDAMWNPPDRYIEVVYPDRLDPQNEDFLSGNGPHTHIQWSNGQEENWCLI